MCERGDSSETGWVQGYQFGFAAPEGWHETVAPGSRLALVPNGPRAGSDEANPLGSRFFLYIDASELMGEPLESSLIDAINAIGDGGLSVWREVCGLNEDLIPGMQAEWQVEARGVSVYVNRRDCLFGSWVYKIHPLGCEGADALVAVFNNEGTSSDAAPPDELVLGVARSIAPTARAGSNGQAGRAEG